MLRVKREYQSWVANESLEDYALRYAASSYRRWGPGVMANTAIGGISFLALEAIGASITLSYGFQTAMVAILVVSLVIFLVSLPIAYWCSVSNVDIDLLTRGAGFGYVGSTITSLIYGSFTLIFFAIETAIWAQALHLALGLQLALGYLLCSLVIIPLVFYGVTLISKLQAWSQPLWAVMLVLPFVFIVYKDPDLLQAWTTYDGLDGRASGFNLLMFGAASGVLFSLVAQIGEQADYLRFLPERTPHNRRAWWSAMLLAGPGWIVIGALKVCAGSLLAVLALRMGSSAAQAVEPVHMFVHAYRQVVDDPALALGLAAVFVTISQVKINVTNAYSGSLAWSNCFVRLAHYHPGRVVWLVFSVVIALLLSLLGIFETLQTVLSVYSTVAIAWIGALVADLVVLKRTGISPPYICTTSTPWAAAPRPWPPPWRCWPMRAASAPWGRPSLGSSRFSSHSSRLSPLATPREGATTLRGPMRITARCARPRWWNAASASALTRRPTWRIARSTSARCVHCAAAWSCTAMTFASSPPPCRCHAPSPRPASASRRRPGAASGVSWDSWACLPRCWGRPSC
jgi:purine-cytosine permease-like protein